MKQFILTNIILALLTVSAHAAPISIGNIDNINVANILVSSSSNASCSTNKTSANCDFLGTTGSLLTDAELGTAATSNVADYIISSSAGNNASFDLGFDGFNLYNGEGNDLVIFIVGNGSNFGLDILDTTGETFSSDSYNVTTDNTVFDNSGNWLCAGGSDNLCTNGYPLSAVFIDFGDNIAGDIALGSLHISLNNAAFSLAGGFHTQPTIATIPLPLPAILFGSGLALLTWVGRKKTR